MSDQNWETQLTLREKREWDREDRAYEKEQEDRKNSRLKYWLAFIAFMVWAVVSLIPNMTQTVNIGENREGIECVIQQLAEHRINNRVAHKEDAQHHDYGYDIEDPNIPLEIKDVDPEVCSKWLSAPPTVQKESGFLWFDD